MNKWIEKYMNFFDETLQLKYRMNFGAFLMLMGVIGSAGIWFAIYDYVGLICK